MQENKITHKEQQEIWNKEHKTPNVLLQMDSAEASGGVMRFWDFVRTKKVSNLVGLEMGCGKGRNVIWLAGQGETRKVYGFDFSEVAVQIAQERAEAKGLSSKTEFALGDATKEWPFLDNFFDFAIDCFASTDIESVEGRNFAVQEIYRTLKPGGLFLLYTLTPDDEFHRQMIKKAPAEERNAFYHTTGKFEKTFDEEELRELYQKFEVLDWQRVDKVTQFFGKEYKCKHAWIIFQKPVG